MVVYGMNGTNILADWLGESSPLSIAVGGCLYGLYCVLKWFQKRRNNRKEQ